MKKPLFLLGFLLLLLFACAGFFYYQQKNNPPISVVTIATFEDCIQAGNPIMESYPRRCRDSSGKTYTEIIQQKYTYIHSSLDMIRIDSPLPGATIGENFTVTGKARGAWFFEASFPITIVDASGKILTQGIAQAKSDWMTSDFVPFTANIKLPVSYIGTATLIAKKDNPSGLPENDASVSFSIIKETGSKNITTVKLYYYNPALDQGLGGTQCSKAGLSPVSRIIPLTMTPIQDAVKLLLRGELSNEERAQGITSEFPLQGLTLQTASLHTGELTLTFLDPNNKTSGGSCRVNILRNQIEATAKQFKEVTSVRFMPAELFQP